MAVAPNADIYANERLNIFFPGSSDGTSNDGNLTGQCVTLLKWFFAEMTSIPNPFGARGDARYVGKRLVVEGLAVEVPYAQRKRGDVVCYEFGTYGHIALQLSGNLVFEQNVNLGGVARKLIKDGSESWYVYASRKGSEAESFRQNVHVYRLKSYNEGGDPDMAAIGFDTANQIHQDLTNRDWDQSAWDASAKGLNFSDTYTLVQNSQARKDYQAYIKSLEDKPTGNAPKGTYLKVDKANIIEVK